MLLSPVLCGIYILIKLESSGPALFRQLRVGHGGRLFSCMKFRTMDHARSDLVSAKQTQPGDPRITRVGAVLRKLSLDELPQLFNVLVGDMSLVGPRPLAPGTSIGGVPVDKLVPDFARRHSVKPGITGLAQARGLRGALCTVSQLLERVAADMEYVCDHSLWLDLKIMVA
ncbi:MAG: sugar transferase, partial [Acetobacteraceae bacterium]|nr:sugar transferase [Acetobacteraceae bacterium]